MRLDAPLILIDYQEKLINAVHDSSKAVANAVFLAECFKAMEKEVFITEQNPSGLGKTVSELSSVLNGYATVFEKYCFSSICDAASKDQLLKERLKKYEQVVICGVETHICVFQTVYDLLKDGYEVFVAYDACSSLRREHHESALETMRSLGARVLPSLSIVYASLESSKAPFFKKVLSLVKAHLR